MPRLRVGDAIRASDGGKVEPRPGVVLKIDVIDGDDWAFVAFGSRHGPKPPYPKPDPVVVTRGDIGFLELRLDAKTYFKCTHGGTIMADDEDDDVIVYGPCPDSLFVALRTLHGFK